MKKALKVGLAVLAASSMASAAHAEMKGSITGHAVGTFESKSGDSGASMDIKGTGRLGYTVSTKKGAWTGTAKVEQQFDGAKKRDHFVQLSNDSMSFKLGYFYTHGSYLGGSYMGANLESIAPLGGSRSDKLVVGLSKVGLDIVIAPTDEESYNAVTTAARYTRAAGNFTFTGAYSNTTGSVDDKRSNHAKGAKGDGLSTQSMDVGAVMSTGKIAIIVAYLSKTNKDFSSASESDTTTVMEAGIDIGIGDGGLSAKIKSEAKNTGVSGAKDATGSFANLTYKMPIGPVPLFLTYSSSSEKSADGVTISNASTGVEMVYGF